MLRTAFRDIHWVLQLLALLCFSLVGAFLASSLAIVSIWLQTGGSLIDVMAVLGNIIEYPSFAYEMQLYSQLGMFLLPAFAAAYLYGDSVKEYLSFRAPRRWSSALWAALSMVIAIPMINLLGHINEQLLVFPESLKWLETWLRAMEDENARMMELFAPTGFGHYLLSLFIIAVMAGVGEELLFRGALQRILEKMTRNHHVVIWVAAILFSAIHLQFYGFIPRMLMGAYFGYLLYMTGSIWVPVAAHLGNNAFVVTAGYALGGFDTSEMEAFDSVGLGAYWWVSLVSLALFLFVFRQIKRNEGMKE